MSDVSEKKGERPEWFDFCVNAPFRNGTVDVEGCPISYRIWDNDSEHSTHKPGIVCVHGNSAHLAWWQFTAPLLADQFRVAAIDLSGNGNSGWRGQYSPDTFAKEVMAVCEAAQLGPNPFIVAHSMGGNTALQTGYQHGTDLGGIVFVDYTIRPPFDFENRPPMWARRTEPRQLRVYEDFETAIGRFRLMPEQPCQHDYVLREVGSYSLKQVEGGWTWKFDPAFHAHLTMSMEQGERFKALKCRTALIVGEKSNNWRKETVDNMIELSGGAMPAIVVPGAYHHLMFDEPVAFVTGLKGILLTWLQQDRRNAR